MFVKSTELTSDMFSDVVINSNCPYFVYLCSLSNLITSLGEKIPLLLLNDCVTFSFGMYGIMSPTYINKNYH